MDKILYAYFTIERLKILFYHQGYQDRIGNERAEYQYHHQNRLNSVSMPDGGNPYNKTNASTMKNHVHEFGPQIPNNVDRMNNDYLAKPRNSLQMENHNGNEGHGNGLTRKVSRMSRDRPYLGEFHNRCTKKYPSFFS